MNYKDIVLNFDIFLDYLNITMFFVVFFISFFVNLFAVWYMWKDSNLYKFITYLNLFSLFMLILVCTNNLVFVFIGWEGIGIFSYLLINFWHTRVNANRSALKAIFVNKIGDIFFYLYIFVYFFVFETFNIFEAKLLAIDYVNFEGVFFNKSVFFLLSFFLIFACMAKSAQIFFHVWLPDAMEGPTPVSALLHAATMVTAGIFILIKFSWLIFLDLKIATFILFIGIFTNFLASLTSMFQNDIKKIIAYSTSSQLGLIFMSYGILKSDLAFFHIFNHALFKALLFMLSGVIIHMFNNKQDYRTISRLNANIYFVYVYILVSSFTLMGVPYLSAFYSKEVMIQSSFINVYLNSFLSLFFMYISVATTIIYAFKIIKYLFYKDIIFRDEYKSAAFKDVYLHIVLFILSLFSIFCGFFYKVLCCSSFVKTFSLYDPFLKIEVEKYFLYSGLEITIFFIFFLFFFSVIISFFKGYFINNFVMFNRLFNNFLFVMNKKFLFDSVYYYLIFFLLTFNTLFVYSFDKVLLESNIRKYSVFLKNRLFKISKLFSFNFINGIFLFFFFLFLNLIIFFFLNLWLLVYFIIISFIFANVYVFLKV